MKIEENDRFSQLPYIVVCMHVPLEPDSQVREIVHLTPQEEMAIENKHIDIKVQIVLARLLEFGTPLTTSAGTAGTSHLVVRRRSGPGVHIGLAPAHPLLRKSRLSPAADLRIEHR